MSLTNNGAFTGPLNAGANTARLVEVTTSGSDITMRTVVSRNFATADYIDNCNFRAAGNTYVDTYGRLILYCHTHHSATGLSTVSPMLKFSEQAP